ncbi:MAG: phosphatidylserine decarboxylase [Staphylococcus sp.]|nr:phosphatidylserine decarboxylase [Staphylococcus sp.]
MADKKYSPVVQELADLIKENNWEDKFNQAIAKVVSYKIPGLSDMTSIEDYLNYLEAYIHWVPAENKEGSHVYQHLFRSFFLLDQEPVKSLQTPCAPADQMPPLSPLSKWMVDYCYAIGDWLDSPESITDDSVKSFYESAVYNMDEYLEPRGGWKTFNQMFARHVKPGYRPIAAIDDDKIIVHPADACFGGQWEIRPDTHVRIKGLDWSIDELLEGSPYKDKFKGGMWCHSFLSWTDYHRQHAPLSGIVREARVIQGACYVDLVAVPDKVNPATNQVEAWRATAPDQAGYEFMQTRGLIVLETKYGYVAILPIAMPQVSSVVITAEEGVALKKGDEISYFQFGGSDIVYLFSANMNVSMSAHLGTHYKVGTKIGEIYPVVEL